jgi:hypothetical protein
MTVAQAAYRGRGCGRAAAFKEHGGPSADRLGEDQGKPVQLTLLGVAHSIDVDTTRTLLRAFRTDFGAPPAGSRLHGAAWLDARRFSHGSHLTRMPGRVYSKSEFRGRPCPLMPSSSRVAQYKAIITSMLKL